MIIKKGFTEIVINKRNDVNMDWWECSGFNMKSCIRIWQNNKSSKTYQLQLVDKHNDKMVCSPMSRKQLLQLSRDIQNFLNMENTDE